MGRFGHAVVIALAIVCVGAAEDVSEHSDTLSAGLQVAFRAYQQCEQQDDIFGCLKLRALRSLDRALRQDRISLVDGVSLVQTPEGSRSFAERPPEEVDEQALPADTDSRNRKLDELLSERVGRFISGHSLQLDVPNYLVDSQQLSLNSLLEEGRGKGGGGGGGGGMKNRGGLMLLALMMKGGLLALTYKAVALLAGKALLVAKIALVLSAIIGLSKLLGGHHEEKTTYEIVKHPHVSHAYTHSSSHEFLGGHGGGGHYDGHGGGHYETSGAGGGVGAGHGWGRSLDAPYPHLVAYRGQLPEGANADKAAEKAVNA